MTERIFFDEQKIPAVCALIRRGLELESDKALATSLKMQIAGLEKYWRQSLADGDNGDCEPPVEKPKAASKRKR